jgi:DNA repair exonuclease SbcCD ATPase subunit
VDEKFKLINEKVGLEGLPDHYHILVASVVYKQWQDPAYKQRAMDLIQAIEKGEKYVSMECLFHGFDYAVVSPDGKSHILSRNEETAFLTNHLRAYGGTGGYQDHKVGRLLRNITFSGKGFVDKPANPESVIFDKHKVFEFNAASVSCKNTLFQEDGVSINDINTTFHDQEESYDMSNEIINDQLKELKEALAAVKAENEQLTKKLSMANVEKYEATIAEMTEENKTLHEGIASSTDEIKEAQKRLAEAEASLAEQAEALETANNAISEMKSAEAVRTRTAMLLEAGISAEDAESKVETFASLDDEQFEALVATFVDYNNQLQMSEVSEVTEPVDEATEVVEETEADEADASDEAEAEEATADEAVLETAEAEEAVVVSVEADPADGTEEADAVRASLQDWVTKCILNSESGE